MRDPKTGYHCIWLTPIMYVLLVLSAGAHKITQLFVRLRSAYVSWRHPEIARIKKLSGMDK
jgi:hypothetical protein